MNRIALTIALLTAATLLPSAAAPANPITIYREMFPNDSSTSNIFSTVAKAETGWTVHMGTGAVEDVASNGWRISYNPVDTSGTAAVAVNSHPARYPLNNRGYLWQGTGPTNAPHILWTDEYVVDRGRWNVAEVNWWQQNGANDPLRVALQIDDNWYASAENFGGTGTVSRSLDFTTADWLSLVFVADDSLALGGSTNLPAAGSITAFGWFTENRTNTLRLDSFEIRAEPTSQPEVIYREIFPNNTGSNIYPDASGEAYEVGWTVHYGNEATRQLGEGPLNTDTWLVSGGSVDTSDAAGIAVNSNPAYEDHRGMLFTMADDTLNEPHILWTDEYRVDRGFWHVTEINWWQNNTAADPIRVALQIDGDWYASDENFGHAGTIHRSLDMGMAAWRSLDFVEGNSLELGSLTNLPSTGAITAFGWFTDGRTNRLRLDSFEIRAVPEPAAGLLLALALVGMATRRRRRRGV